ncbi:hypothetical protein SAMN04487926_14430 [Paraburkholderia steynii]|uniref:Uncharacterized protein n=1 Tax=Paraburkholderia steynii TaxID=1245441 RepID=A0A7Z7BIY4_9BURK|nr:hypothetical protein SAMN04487926_14430 [Paraburkholderia steynii]
MQSALSVWATPHLRGSQCTAKLRPAAGRFTAMTRVLVTDVVGHLAVDRETVVDEKLFARLDAGEGVDEDAIARLG